MTGINYPQNVQKFMDWYQQNPLALNEDYGYEAENKEAIKKVTTKADECGLKFIIEKATGASNTSVIVFDPKIPEQAYTVSKGKSDVNSLPAARQTQFNDTFKELSGLIADHDLSEADLNRIAALRVSLYDQGVRITVVKKDEGCYIGLSMAGNAKYAHATLKHTK